MKRFTPLAAFFCLCFSAVVLGQGTAFTYQGRLTSGSSSANGVYNLSFSLFATNTGGTPVAGPVTNTAISVSNGLFTAIVDFGPNAFTGGTGWLDIAVCSNGMNAFTELTPRQQLTPVPYAVFANAASNLVGTIQAGQISGTLASSVLPGTAITNNESGVSLSGTFSGNFSGLTNPSSATLSSIVLTTRS